MDTLTKEERSRVMSRIHSRDTAPELVVRRFLWEKGFRYRTCMKSVLGHPDIVFRKYRTLIEIRGCFWHRHEGCSLASDPKSNLAFWNAKFERNVARDLEHEKYWHEHGWNVIVVWECGLRKKNRAETLATILHHLEPFGVSASCHL